MYPDLKTRKEMEKKQHLCIAQLVDMGNMSDDSIHTVFVLTIDKVYIEGPCGSTVSLVAT